MVVAYRVFDEVIDFITSVPPPEKILAYKPSPTMQKRLDDLLEKKMEGTLTEAEQAEIDQCLLIEHLMRLAKAKAKKRLAA